MYSVVIIILHHSTYYNVFSRTRVRLDILNVQGFAHLRFPQIQDYTVTETTSIKEANKTQTTTGITT